MINLSTDIQFLKGVGEKKANILKSKGIDTVGALLHIYPRTYLDWSDITPISDCEFNVNSFIKVTAITPVDTFYKKQGMVIYKFMAEDETAQIEVTLFNQKYTAEKIICGNTYLLYGKISGSFVLRQVTSPIIKPAENNKIQPIYATLKNISSAGVERLVANALENVQIEETIPEYILKRNNLCDKKTALLNIHFPKSNELLNKAKIRLVFEELFILQTGLSLLKRKSRGYSGAVLKDCSLEKFLTSLSFELTSAQKRVIDECIADMKSGKPMNRLIEGDVGSGKTVVAAALCFLIAENGFQSALMAPTEILAEQHFKTISNMIKNTNIKCELLTGSNTKKQKELIKKKLLNGEIDVIIGTHALLSDNVRFKNLSLVITDEQHRFGVAQRGKLSSKGNNPHTLVMSATPIPRTLGLIIYGDLDISIIDEYPKGRMKIDTFCVNTLYHKRIYNFIKKYLDNGNQAYIVCPLVDENDEQDLVSAEEYYNNLSNNEFNNYSVGILHGKMPSKEKEDVMKKFSEGQIQLLISTTVIEVGIDVSNAVIMVIENAERFGLSQLHQLRGRIGRGSLKSYCILISDSKSETTKKRLDIICNSNDGFEIADEDLALRGPGDFLGSRQHGLPDMKIADIFSDRETLKLAGNEAEQLLISDPKLLNPKNKCLREQVKELYKQLVQN